MATIRITQIRSAASRPKDQRATLQALGLRGPRSVVEHEDKPPIVGMVEKVGHLVEVKEVKKAKR